MSLISKLQDIYARYFSTDMAVSLDYSNKLGLQDVQAIAAGFPEPKDDIQRSFYQYLCSVQHLSTGKRFLINFAALFLLIPYVVKMRFAKVPFREKADAVFLVADHISEGIIPSSLSESFSHIRRMNPGDVAGLNAQAMALLRSVFSRTWQHPYFNLKVAVKLGFLVGAIEAYRPRAIIHNTESSFASSILTSYCESESIEYIGVMHGEYLVNPKDAFFRCTAFYVWDGHYRGMLSSIRCDPDQFRVEQPPCLAVPGYDALHQKDFDYTFYLQKESKEEMHMLAKSVETLIDRGAKVSLRPHPKFFDKDVFLGEFGPDGLSLLQECSLAESLSRTKNAVGRFSTVLYQSYLLGIPVVLDDITDGDLAGYLSRANYIMLTKEHGLLSEMIVDAEEHDKASHT